MKRFRSLCLLTILLNLLMFAAACDSSWIAQANSIIAVLLPAITAGVALVGSFVGIPPALTAAIMAWGKVAQDALTNIVKPAIDAYNNADAGGKAALLDRIKAALDSVVANLHQVFADAHIADPKLQSKIVGIFGLIESMFVALANFLPVLQNKIDPHSEEAHALAHAVMPAKEFKKQFNALTEEFGDQYTI